MYDLIAGVSKYFHLCFFEALGVKLSQGVVLVPLGFVPLGLDPPKLRLHILGVHT